MSSFGGINPSAGSSYLTIGEGSKMEDESHLIADEDVVDKTIDIDNVKGYAKVNLK